MEGKRREDGKGGTKGQTEKEGRKDGNGLEEEER